MTNPNLLFLEQSDRSMCDKQLLKNSTVYTAYCQTACGELKIMTWPPQSPGFNPIELLWDQLDCEVQKECPTSITHLWSILQQVWNDTSPINLDDLIKRMPKLVCAVRKAKNGFFNEKEI